MKTQPAFDQLVGHSHAVDTKVELRAADGTVVAALPVEAGTVVGDATRRVGRWSGTVTVAGLDWAPDGPTHPLAGMSGHYCSVQRAGTGYGAAAAWVEVARLWVVETQVQMSRRGGTLQVRLESPAALLDRAVHDDYQLHRADSAQQTITRVLSQHLPYTPAVLDTSTAATLPADWAPTDTTPDRVADDLAAAVNCRVYFDALGRIVIRPTLPSLDLTTFTPTRHVDVDVDVVSYTLTFGRDQFANDATARYDWQDSAGARQTVVGRAATTTGPLRKDGPAGRLTVDRRVDGPTTQQQADGYAQAMLTAQSQAWVQSSIDAVQDPRVEPDDVIETRYLDRTLRHRVVQVRFDLRTDAMQITARTTVGSP